MMDLICAVSTVLLFAVAFAYLHGCDTLKGTRQ